MKFKPSVLEQYINTLPEDLQILALQIVKEEHDRWKRGDLTPEEKARQETVREFAKSTAQTMEKIAIKCIANPTNPPHKL